MEDWMYDLPLEMLWQMEEDYHRDSYENEEEN